MLTEGHPHAWDANRADEHLDDSYRKRYLAKGGRLVVTPQLRQLAEGMPTALDRCAAIAVSGPYGAGKSTLLTAVAAISDVNVAFANIPKGVTPKQQWEVLTKAITGRPATGSARQMQEAAKEYLTAVPTLLIVDEAQFIGLPALLQLRWLWDHDFPKFAIVLAGSNLFEHLEREPSISTRIDRRIELRHQTRERMVQQLLHHLPQARATEQRILDWIDDAYAQGSWRAWSHLLRTITIDFKHTGAITEELAAAVIFDITRNRPTSKPAAA